MKYTRFEELPAWQAATKLSLAVYAFSAKPPLRRLRALRDQIERASVSVSNNIAEGFERGTTQELLTFLSIARGSAGEVRSMLCLMERMEDFSNLKSEIAGGGRFPPASGLGASTAGLIDQGHSLSDFQNTQARRSTPRTGSVSAGTSRERLTHASPQSRLSATERSPRTASSRRNEFPLLCRRR